MDANKGQRPRTKKSRQPFFLPQADTLDQEAQAAPLAKLELDSQGVVLMWQPDGESGLLIASILTSDLEAERCLVFRLSALAKVVPSDAVDIDLQLCLYVYMKAKARSQGQFEVYRFRFVPEAFLAGEAGAHRLKISWPAVRSP